MHVACKDEIGKVMKICHFMLRGSRECHLWCSGDNAAINFYHSESLTTETVNFSVRLFDDCFLFVCELNYERLMFYFSTAVFLCVTTVLGDVFCGVKAALE